jgi:hypothetical protein
MRRLLALLLAASPAAALPQSAGQIYFGGAAEYVVNQAACKDPGATVRLTWVVQEETAGVFDPAAGRYEFYASPTDRTDAFPYCVVDEARRLTDETLEPPFSAAGSASLPVSQLVSKAGYDCVSGDETIFVCVVWLNDAGAVKAYAKGDVGLRTSAPDAPTVVSVSPGEEALYVRIEAAATGAVEAAEFRALAYADGSADTATHLSAWDSDGRVRIGGLVNGVAYTVVAIARSEDGNESPVSAEPFGPSAETTPVSVRDGWENYEAAFGQDSGGCQAGGAGILALASAAALLRLRRRRAEIPQGSRRRP